MKHFYAISDLVERIPQTEPCQLAADKCAARLSLPLLFATVLGPGEQLACYQLYIRVPIDLVFAEHMPDHNQQLARNRHDRPALASPLRQPDKFSSPIGMMPDRDPGGLNHCRPQIAPTLFGDRSTAMGLARVMHTRAQPAVADQLGCRGETRDVADCGEHRHGRVHTNARQVDQEWHLFGPGGRRAQADEFGIHLGDQRFEGVKQPGILTDPQLLGERQLQGLPPIAHAGGKAIGGRSNQIVAE